ncbi:hypothetical protein B9Z19DRAFT_1071646 [Tuber borchii]|uniref:Uncharacterized protein n=1 Tax=Tuber borchii TaxID=42251 RepID=A0A2T7A7T0_TUBBO|nr:hypothetical protein B9Z19DRAFT_1071646 [Tuber borchii]
MPHRQTLSRRPDATKTPPETDSTEELLTNGSEDPPLEPLDSGDLFYSDLLRLILRFFLTFCSLGLLVICLWQFSGKGPLDKWQQRCFNTLSILLTGIASLGLGSLIGCLGSMLRWPLLARTMHKMQDVDLILGMAPPTGSLWLIWGHLRKGGTSRTTWIVAAYLIINIFGRLSVAVFGLTYNMMDRTGIEYPILSTNWDSVSWAGYYNVSATFTPILYDPGVSDDYWNSVWNGVRKYAKKPKWLASSVRLELYPLTTANSSGLLSELRIENSTLEEPVGPNTVEYSYQLKDYHEGYAIISNHTVHSAVNCSLVEVSSEGQYWRWNNWDRTGPFDWDSDEVLSHVLAASNETYFEYKFNYPYWVSFAYTTHEPSHVYIVCSEIAWECSPTLTETVANKSSQPHQRLFHSASLYALPASGKMGRFTPEDLTKEDNFTYSVYVNQLPSSQTGPNALDGLNGPEPICFPHFTMPLDKIRWNTYTLWVSGLVARLPILAITYENTAHPQYTRDTHSNRTAGTAYLHTTLEVNWNRVTITAASIGVGQILAILIVLSYCNGVYTRDDSHLATAELLKTVITRFDGGKLMTGEELAVSLDRALGVSVSYGTREGQDGGPPEVDLASGLDLNFPPFPHKRRFRRKNSQKIPEVQ